MLIWASRLLFFIALFSVTCLAVLPQEQVSLTTGWDKANHALAFLVLLGLLDQAYPQWNLWLQKTLPLIGYGLVIEGLQFFLPDRMFSLLDVAADLVGLGVYLLLRPRLLEKLPFIDRSQFQ